MIPDYQKFISFQDKRVIPFFFAVILVVVGFYWKNNDYQLTQHNVWPVSALLAIVLFNFIYDLKAFWAYSCVIGRVDVNVFSEKPCGKLLNVVSRPVIISTLMLWMFWIIATGWLSLPATMYSVLCFYITSSCIVYLVFRWLRPVYIRQVLTSATPGVKYRHLYQYVSVCLFTVTLLNVISVSPLAQQEGFSLREGFLSIRLMVAMLILCTIVLAINLAFARISKRYVFLGRIFLKEIDFFFSKSVPFSRLSSRPLIIRILIVLFILAVWIVAVSTALSLLQWQIRFEWYFLFCFLPCMGYCFLHTWWQYHHEFMMACDMYFRYEAFNKRNL
ncbi:hypothetical protein [Pantoea phytobeneficialis]|uniref:Inner membrane protein n=1 Tax=Pantoea phytobeneficialis TaxID=2052056 RepID=A0AAP9H4U7_9GAMM|nr:hypothetical protein [Pantoea phytobeneficialis]MDO6406129.1 hypothetical protein [Pantoea phytobeneficialis]QGR06559.1 hypothetical protein CTZ24_09100 [Pantoea phytobeneficialis]